MRTTASLFAWNRRGIAFGGALLAAACTFLSPATARGEAMLQFFNAKWTEIAAKAPELAEAGYTSIWLPPPAKANGGYSVGYDLFDPFDLGSTDLRGTWSTRYGTEAELHNLVDTLHRFGIRVYFDNIMNHRAYDVPGYNENTPIDVYPGMVAEDFHLRRTSDGYYRKWDNCRDWNDGWQVMNLGLSDLIDIAHESPNCNHGTYEGATQEKPFVVRHPNNPEFYDYAPDRGHVGFGPNNGITTNTIAENPDFFKEDVGGYLCRAVRWMMDTTKADGFRLDAVKHVPDSFFGKQWGDDKDEDSSGYLGNIQWQFNKTHGYSDLNHRDTVFDTDAPRDDAMVFGEHLGDPPPLDGYIAAGMRLVDNPLRNQLVSAISSYNLWGYENAGWGGLAPGCGVMHSQSHDNVPQSMDRRPLEQCFYMMREGLGLFYTDGNNHAATLNGSGGAFPRWAESAYLGQWGDTRMPNLCQLNGDFGRGWQHGVGSRGDFVAWERIDERHGGTSWADKVTCLVLANAGWDYGQPLPKGDDWNMLDNVSFPHQGGGEYGSDAYLYQYADVPYVDWNPHFYTYASALNSVIVPANAYFIFGYKNPDPSSIWPGNVIDVLEDGQVAATTPLVRTDGVDGDAGYNPYSLPDDDNTDYSYTIHVPRITKGTNVQFRVNVDGSAGNVMLRLDGGMDLNNTPNQYGDMRDNQPAVSDDVYLGFEDINFDQRIWPEKFAAADSANCALGSGDATTFVSESSGATNYASTASNDFSNHLGQVSWVYHDPNDDTEAFFEGASATATAVAPASRAVSPRGSAGWLGATYIYANGWYKGDSQSHDNWNPTSFAGAPLGSIDSLELGGQAQTYGESDGEGNPVRLKYSILSGNSSVQSGTVTLYWYDYKDNNNWFESRTGNSGTWHPSPIDLSGLTSGSSYTLKVWFEANGSNGTVNDAAGTTGYSATFTYTSGGGGGGSTHASKQLVRSGTSVTVYAKSQKADGMSAALYYTTDGSSWPNGAGQVAANPETKVVNGQWFTNTITHHDSGVTTTNDWWKFDITLPSADATLRYKIGVFHRQGTLGTDDYRIIWPGSEGDITQKLPMLGQWSTIPQDLTTKDYYKHNDCQPNEIGHGLPDGLHLLTARAFLNRTKETVIYKTFRQTFMIDRETPRGELLYPDANTHDIGGSEYGFILHTDPTVTAVYYHITDANPDNDGVGNGMVSNQVVWGQATAAGAWTKEMAQDTQFPQLWRFTYNRIPSGGSNAIVRIRLVETSSASTNQWSADNPAEDSAAALHCTEIEREFHTWGDPENFYFQWPDTDGTYVEEGWHLRLNFSKKLTSGIDPYDAFKLYIQTEENASTNRGTLFTTNDVAYTFDWRSDGDDEATLTIPMPNVYNGIQGWLYGVRVELVNTNAGHNYVKAATRFVTHHGARKPTVAITTPPEVDSDGAAYIIEMPDVPASVLAAETNAWMRQTPIVVQTDPAVTNVAIAFLAAPEGASTALEFKGMTTNTGSLAAWSWVWTVSAPGTYRFTATGWANTNGTTLTVASNAVLRNATVQFKDIVSNTETNNLDWDDDGILNTNENTAVSLPAKQGEYWTQAEVFAHFASGKSSDTSPDTDGDGLPDALELGYRAVQDASATDTTADTNGDGIPNFLPDLDPPFYNTTDNYGSVPYAENSSGGSSRSWMCAGSVTDPSNPDSDYDGIPDGLEDTNRNGWTDGDGEPLPVSPVWYNPWLDRKWPDGKMTGETWLETSPCLADSDADGLSDGYGEDTNRNGRVDMFLVYENGSKTEIILTNSQWAVYRAVSDSSTSRGVNYDKLFEDYAVDGSYTGTVQKGNSGWPHVLILETDPLCTDTDHDGLPDGWEIRYGLDPLDNGVYNFRTGLAGDVRNGPDGDPDDDNVKNLTEFSSGTNPTVSDSAANPGGEGAIVIGEGKWIGEVNGTDYYREYLDWTLDDLVALDDYDHGENSSDIYRKFGDGYNSSRDLIAFYFHDGGESASGGDDKLYFRVDLFDLQAHVEERGGLNVYVAINFGNYGTGIEDLPNDVDCKTAMKWNAVAGVYNSADGVLYVKDKDGDGFSAVEHGYYGAHFNSQLDTIAWSVNRNALTNAGWGGDPDRLLFQVYTTRANPGGDGDKWGLNDLCDTFGDTFLCSDYDQDWDYVASHGTYSTCIGRTAGGPVWNNRGQRARLALLAHGNQAVERACAIQDYVNNGAGAGYHRPVKIHNIYTNCPLNLHITPTLAMALQWAAVDPGSGETWRSGPALNAEIAEGVAKGNFRLLGSTYADHILPFFSKDFNAANIALANDTLNTIYGGSPTSSVVSTDILWSSERVADLATLQQIHDLGYRATVIDQVPHIQDWFGRETALGDDGYKLQHFYLERAVGDWDSLDAFSISTTAADYRYAAHDSGLSTELRQMFLRRAQSGANVVSTLFYNWEDFANQNNADAYDQCLRWIANHPWIQVVTFEDALDTVDKKNRDLLANLGMSMQDWVNHACNGNYSNWFFGSQLPGGGVRHESLASKTFEIGSAFKKTGGGNLEMTNQWGSMSSGVLSNAWAAVNGIRNPSVKRLALQTLGASVFETAFHSEDNNNLSRWSYGDYVYPSIEPNMGLQGFAWCAQGQTRMAAIYSAVDDWAGRTLSKQEIVTNLDLDLDGIAEPVLRNDAVMAVFERQGGRMVGAWIKQRGADGATNVVQMIGNFVSMPYSGMEDEGLDNENARRAAGLTDWWNNSTNSVNLLYNVKSNATYLTLTNTTTHISKKIYLEKNTSTTFKVVYQMAGNGNFCVRTGLSPDLDALLTLGDTALTEQSGGSSTLILTTTNPAASRVSSVTVNVTTGAINTAATDIYATNNPTVPLRNLAQTRQVEIQTDGNRLDFTIDLSTSSTEPEEDPGTPPVWSAIPAISMTVGDTTNFVPADYVTGDPAPEITLLSTTATSGYTFADGNLVLSPTASGNFDFVFRAANTAGTKDATLGVSVAAAPELTDYQKWLVANNLSTNTSPSATNATSGRTYEWHYATDIAPTSDIPLEIVITNAAKGTFTIDPASPNRYYQLLYTTNLLDSFVTTNIGWGSTAPVRFPVPGDWYGRLKVLLEAP